MALLSNNASVCMKSFIYIVCFGAYGEKYQYEEDYSMSQTVRVYAGTYTCPIRFGTGQILEGKGEGIYLLELDPDSGQLSHIQTFAGIVNPSYLVLSKDHRFLYAVNELKEYKGAPSGSVSSFAVSPSDGALRFINTQATLGTDPCHVELSPDGAHVLVSNFMSGSVCVLPVRKDGSLAPSSQFIQHAGSSVNKNRQAGPHAHSLIFAPDGRFAFVPDLGIDKLVTYRIISGEKPLGSAPVPHLAVTPGAGPRHCAFGPDGRYCYLINELDSTILTLRYNVQEGSFTMLQKVSSLPEGVSNKDNTCADVHITPNGAYLYGSNRGHDSLIIYSIDRDSGLLSYAGCQPCGGRTPRNFAIDPTGSCLLCANQDSDNIVVFSIDYASGALQKKSETTLPTPVCLRPYTF